MQRQRRIEEKTFGCAGATLLLWERQTMAVLD
jgi:hypothetical protein